MGATRGAQAIQQNSRLYSAESRIVNPVKASEVGIQRIHIKLAAYSKSEFYLLNMLQSIHRMATLSLVGCSMYPNLQGAPLSCHDAFQFLRFYVRFSR
jgi:hypothetical protein